jgi:hypothetical protein
LTKIYPFDKVYLMKFYLPIIAVLAVLLTPLYPVYAESNSFAALPSGAPAPVMTTAAGRPEPVRVSAQANIRVATPSARTLPLPSFKPLSREEVASKEALLKQKLTAFKDQNKAARVERISNNLNQINQNRITEMTNKLDKMTLILNKLSDILSSDASVGKDTASAAAAISTANSTVQAAKEAVATQKQANYTMTVSSESTVRTAALTDKNTLVTAMNALQTFMVTARKNTEDALMLTMIAMKGTASNGQ